MCKNGVHIRVTMLTMETPSNGRRHARWSEARFNNGEEHSTHVVPHTSEATISGTTRFVSNTVILAGIGTLLLGAGGVCFRAMFVNYRFDMQ